MLANAVLKKHIICILFVLTEERKQASGKFDIVIQEDKGTNQTF